MIPHLQCVLPTLELFYRLFYRVTRKYKHYTIICKMNRFCHVLVNIIESRIFTLQEELIWFLKNNRLCGVCYLKANLKWYCTDDHDQD